MMNYRRIVAVLFTTVMVAAICGFTSTDDGPIEKIAAQLDKWLSSHPQEKVYLQLDKPCYATGDDIWFKAYITVGSSHQLSALSRVLNVELIDDKDSVSQSIKLPVTAGLTWGDFALPDTLKEGNYRIRAYTNWMRNAGEAYFFDKTIAIVNATGNDVFAKATYTFSTQNGQAKTNATVNYSNSDGTPYAGTPVSYEIHTSLNNVIKGKGQTDDKGNINISFAGAATNPADMGRIVTTLKLAGKKAATKSLLIKAASGKVDVQFFAEGGSLVNGNFSKIAFKAVGADGLGAAIKGAVMDDQNNQVATFSTSNLGMGIFNLKPESGKTYKAQVTYADGSVNTVALPVATTSGYSLSVDNSADDKIIVKIIPGAVISAAQQTGTMSLIGQMGGVIYYAGQSKPGSKFFTAAIPKSKFPTGIVQLTLFTETGEPLNERLVFIQHADQLKLGVSTEKQTYAPREKVKINLNAADASGNPVTGSFSVSVTDDVKVPVDENAENTILSNLLLTSDLRGYIEKPGYYFNNPNQQTAADLDVLMLTQGYHRFEWKQVLNDSFPPAKFEAEKSLEISGHIKTLLGKPVVNGKVTLFSTAGGAFLVDTISDKSGKFTFTNLVFRDSVRFVIQARTSRDRKNLQIELDNITPQTVGANKNAADLKVNITDGLDPFLQNSKLWYDTQLKYGIGNHAILLKEVKIKAQKAPLVENSSNLNGPGNANQVLKADDIGRMGCAKLTDCLQGMLFGVTFRNDTPYSNRSLSRPMQIIVNGVYVDATVLNDLNAADIETIEVLRSIEYLSVYGGRGSNGVLVITTKRGGGSDAYQHYAPGIITYMPRGYYKSRVFYSPQYDNPKTNAALPDLRSTIYWKPNIITGKDGKASFEFFNADGKTTYKVVVEGIDNNGNLGRQVFRYRSQ